MPTSDPTDRAPIVVFAYNRRDHLAAMLRSLARCEGFANSPITIFVDGPRGEADRAAVDDVRAFVTGLGLPNLRTVISEENKGLRNSIYAGVSQVVAEHGRAIVLEDDLALSPIALSYFNAALDRYADDPRVWNVSGYIFDVPELRDFPRALTLPYASSWGWATWDRAWSRFDLDARPSEENLRAASFQQAIDMNGMYPIHDMLNYSIRGQINSWAVHWSYMIFRNGGRSIFPPRRIVENHGFVRGTHGTRLNPREYLVGRPALLEQVPSFEDADEIDYFALDLIKRCREARVQRLIHRAGAVKRSLPRKKR